MLWTCSVVRLNTMPLASVGTMLAPMPVEVPALVGKDVVWGEMP